MFSEAYKSVSEFTRPVIVSMRYYNGTVKSAVGTYIILNEEGWILTAAHLLQPFLKAQQDQKAIAAFERSREDGNDEQELPENAQQWITNLSYWWGGDNLKLEGNVAYNGKLDLAVAQLDFPDAANLSYFPILKNPTQNIDPGTSLCKLGYPLYKLEPSFNEQSNTFEFPDGTLPIPRFPIEGIFTRQISEGKTDDGYPIKFLETSSPGLRGQSGGPIFDTHARIWALQSKTINHTLGFNPQIEHNGNTITEHQFLNTGIGVHCEAIVAFLEDQDIHFKLSDE